jgi:hypothetical protein
LTPAKGRQVLNSAAAYLALNYGFRAQQAIDVLSQAHARLKADKMDQMVAVYRMHQQSMFSPCILGSPCSVCAAHAECHSACHRGEPGRQCQDCRRGRVLCPRAAPAEPAFYISFTRALVFVRHGLATFINNNKALRLTFSKIAQLRDRSLKIDENALIAYADDLLFQESRGRRGKRNTRARSAIRGWRFNEPVVEVPAAVMAASKERIQCFT